MTPDAQHVTHNIWWEVNIISALTIWNRQCLEDSKQKDHWMDERINYKGVYRTAPATLALLISQMELEHIISHSAVCHRIVFLQAWHKKMREPSGSQTAQPSVTMVSMTPSTSFTPSPSSSLSSPPHLSPPLLISLLPLLHPQAFQQAFVCLCISRWLDRLMYTCTHAHLYTCTPIHM